jgi:hypothetical protein
MAHKVSAFAGEFNPAQRDQSLRALDYIAREPPLEHVRCRIVHHVCCCVSHRQPQVRPFGLMTGVSEQRKQLSSAPFSIAPWRRSRKWGAAGCLSPRI